MSNKVKKILITTFGLLTAETTISQTSGCGSNQYINPIKPDDSTLEQCEKRFFETETFLNMLDSKYEYLKKFIKKKRKEIIKFAFSDSNITLPDNDKIRLRNNIQLTRAQCAQVIMRAFFNQYDYQKLNFNKLFIIKNNETNLFHAQKIACFINYFKQIIENNNINLNEIITMHRKSLPNGIIEPINDQEKTKPMSKLLINIWDKNSEKKIILNEKCLVMDFANKKIGGGVMNEGAVQEEIMFLKYTELCAFKLYSTKEMSERESIIIENVICYNKLVGYSHSIKFNGSQKNIVNLKINVLAVDAVHFYKIQNKGKQYRPTEYEQYEFKFLKREIIKLRSGLHEENINVKLFGGAWGCGAFNGNLAFKFLIQWLVCSIYNVTFEFEAPNNNGEKMALELLKIIKDKKMNVGDVYKGLYTYNEHFKNDRNLLLNTYFKEL